LCPYAAPMTRRRVALIASALVLLGAGAGASWLALSNQQDETPSWLFSQTSDSGSLRDQGDGTFVLILNDIDAHTIGFTDRPNRDSAIIATKDFVEAWPNLFADSAPNAVLVEHQPDGAANSIVLTLETPTLAESTLTFEAVLLTEEVPQSVAEHAGTLHPRPPETFEVASLFIDDVPCEVQEDAGVCAPGDPGVAPADVAP